MSKNTILSFEEEWRPNMKRMPQRTIPFFAKEAAWKHAMRKGDIEFYRNVIG